jgi:glycosyltransferase involved in cell wall biosynthesis
MRPGTDSRPRVLMVTGAYSPELSGASLQCRALVRALVGKVDFSILTTATDPRLPLCDEVDGISVYRIVVDPTRLRSKAAAVGRMTRAFWHAAADREIVHFHGFSQKTALLTALARLGGKRIVMKLTSIGHDDARSLVDRGAMARWTASQVDCFVAPSAAFSGPHAGGPFVETPLRVIPNGVDVTRFTPPDAIGRRAARRAIGVADEARVVLHVGFFSHDKAVDVLFNGWAESASRWTDSVLLLVGATRSAYYEVDPAIASRIREDARRRGLSQRVLFVERTDDIELYYRAADVFVIPSLREGLPNVLLEAMATGVACIASRLPGVTDTVIDHGTSGVLVPPRDTVALTSALDDLLRDPLRAAAIGAAARQTIVERYGLDETARQHLTLYRDLLRPAAPRPA